MSVTDFKSYVSRSSASAVRDASYRKMEGIIAELRKPNAVATPQMLREFDEAENEFRAAKGYLEGGAIEGDRDELHRITGERGATSMAKIAATSLTEFLKRDSHEFDLGAGIKGRHEKRDIYTTTTGAPVPQTMGQRIIRRLIESSGVLAAGPQIIRTTSGESYTLPEVKVYGTATITGQGTAIAESDPTLGGVTFGAFRYGNILQVSWEMLTDAANAADFEGMLGDAMGNAITQGVAPHLANGTGTTQPLGLFASSAGYATAVTGGTGVAGAPSYNNLVDTFFALPSPYRTNASWIMSDATMAGIAKLTDDYGRSLLVPSLSGDTPTQLLGKPVYVDNNVADAAVNAKSLFFGDVSRAYAVRFAGPMSLERSDQFAFDKALATFRCLQRLDGHPVDTDAGVFYRGGTA